MKSPEIQILEWLEPYSQPGLVVGVSYVWLKRQVVPDYGFLKVSELNRGLSELKKAGLIEKARVQGLVPISGQRASFTHYKITDKGQEMLKSFSS